MNSLASAPGALPQTRGGCLSDEEASLFAHGLLEERRADALRAHVMGCEGCGQLLVELARLATGASTARHVEAGPAPSPSHPRYEVVRMLGAGGMGVVFEARDRQLDRVVAIKLMRSERDDSGSLVDEARSLARVSHPHVVQVHDVVAAGGDGALATFVTMERVEGSSLRVWSQRERPAPARVLETLLGAGEGLAALHAAGLVHRDFKPDNVLIGADGRARVADLGLAVRSTSSARAHAGGTPPYMAPELLDHGAPASERSDQFAYAVAFCEVLGDGRPFEGSTVEELRAAYARGAAPRLPRGSALARSLAPALRRALALEPARRFESMQVLLHELRRASLRRGRALRWTHVVMMSAASLLHWAATAAQIQMFVADEHVRRHYGGGSGLAGGGSDEPWAQAFVMWFILAILCSFAWNPICALLAPATALGLARRHAWARWGLVAYAILSIPFVFPLPYALFALWSARAPSLRAELTR